MTEQQTQTEKKPNLKSELEHLGFTRASTTVDYKLEIARKMAIAFEHYRVVTDKNFERFNRKLKRRTFRIFREGRYKNSTWQYLQFTPIQNYEEIPPQFVLEKLKEAKKFQCFDGFEVATLGEKRETHRMIPPDPILFGIINGTKNKYFIAQWDDDVAIEDILKEGEG